MIITAFCEGAKYVRNFFAARTFTDGTDCTFDVEWLRSLQLLYSLHATCFMHHANYHVLHTIVVIDIKRLHRRIFDLKRKRRTNEMLTHLS